MLNYKDEKSPCHINNHDLKRIRELAKTVKTISQTQLMSSRVKEWTAHNDLKNSRPMILLELIGLGPELANALTLECEGDYARDIESSLAAKIFAHEQVNDDSVVDSKILVNWDVHTSNYGVDLKENRITDSNGRSVGFHFDIAIKDLKNEFNRLKKRSFTVDRESTYEKVEHLREVYDGILDVEIGGSFWWTQGMTLEAVMLIGLEKLMLNMYDEPDALHQLMQFILEDHISYARWLERENLLSLNNGNSYIGSGSRGYTGTLPLDDYAKGTPVRLKDLWVLLESQETVGVSPEMFGEFIFPYQKELSKLFGLTYYGCCEPLNNRWNYVNKIENLRSVSISPWCNEEVMGVECKDRYVYSRKPSPTMLSMESIDEKAIYLDIENTMRMADGCNIEIVMKDLHTVHGDLSRVKRWVDIAREVTKCY